MITYNHEEYIAQAIEGVLMQRTSFPVELIIGNDASTDETRDIALNYQEKYPDKIFYHEHSQNVGMLSNFTHTLGRCTQKYIAFCEGDDYWIDPDKLEKQVKFMETDNDFVLCFHDSKVYNQEKEEVFKECILCENQDFEIEISELILKNIIPSQSILFRNHLISKYPDWFWRSETGDFPIYILLSKFGRFKYLSFLGSVYRRHSGGVTYLHKTNLEAQLENSIKKIASLNNYNSYTDFQYSDAIKARKELIINDIIDLSFMVNNYSFISIIKGEYNYFSVNGIKRKIKYVICLLKYLISKKRDGRQ